uniref:Uncharacterized protein n=1 Tax=Branchiostoma floridae TaxID=7739 RepID=C3Y9G5_BRAFL|eukprot:XP_002607211.1 hypothetical protein BRAFLDRAFT_67991 [Branchiostoma floridae]
MEEKTGGFLGTLREYGENTSAHGIPRAVTTKSLPRRLFWTCLFLASFSYFCSQAYDLVNKYLDYPVTTDIKIEWSELEFPAVTICNANPLRFSELRKLGHEGFQNAGFIPKPDRTPQNNQGNAVNNIAAAAGGRPQQKQPTTVPPTTTTRTETTTPGDYEDYEDYDYDYDDHHEDFKTANTFMGLIANMNSTTRQAIGHQARDFIQECQFDGRACSPKNFSVFTDSTYGNCFTFNKAIGNTAPQRSTSAGPLNGLSLILYIQQEEYIPSLTEKAGARVVVHSPDRWPFPEFEGFDASPGFLTSAGLRLNCLVTCHQQHMVSVCGCADPSFKATVNTAFCDSVTTTVPRTEQAYDKKRTSSRCRRNLLKLNIYYEALNYEQISESPGYEEESLLGDLGGQLGLWVGMSLLSAMEVVEIFADLFAIIFKKFSSKEMKSSKKIDVAPREKIDANDLALSYIKGNM